MRNRPVLLPEIYFDLNKDGEAVVELREVITFHASSRRSESSFNERIYKSTLT